MDKPMPKSEKKAKSPSKEELLAELAELRERLREAEETIEAIRSGAVDAIVVSGAEAGERIYTLQGADHSYRQLVEAIREGTVTMSPDGTILYSNRQFAAMLGYPLEKIIGDSFLNYVSPGDRPAIEAILRRGADESARLQVRLCSYEWGKIPTQIAFSAIDSFGARAVTALVADLSEQLRYQEIVQHEKLSRSIMEHSPSGIAVCDLEGRIIRQSEALSALCDTSPLMRPFDEVFRIEIPTGKGPSAPFLTASVLRGEAVRETEARLYCGGRDARDVTISAVPLRNDERAIMGCLITLTDITERKQAEAKVRMLTERLSYHMEHSPLAVIEWGPDMRLIRWAGEAERIFGWRADEVIGKRTEDFRWIYEEDASNVAEVSGDLRSGVDSMRFSANRNYRKDGSVIHCEWYNSSMLDDRGKLLSILSLVLDVTDRKKAEEALNRQTAKLEAANRELDSFAYSVSHDLRTPLRAIDGFSRMLLTKMADKLTDDEKRQFEVIRDSTQKMGQLIDDLLAFSRLGRQAMAISRIDVASLAMEIWNELLPLNPGRAMRIEVSDPPSAMGDPALIKQVVSNLLSNAVKFTRKKESATIEVGGTPGNSENTYFVRDNGAGFDMKYSDKLFGVFQRLHSPEEFEGSGAGLAIVQRIVHRHGGRIWAEAEPDRGATFHFTLPSAKP